VVFFISNASDIKKFQNEMGTCSPRLRLGEIGYFKKTSVILHATQFIDEKEIAALQFIIFLSNHDSTISLG